MSVETPRARLDTVEFSPFIGRQQELRELEELLASSRLVSIVGIGGIGKSRLARKAISRMKARWFVCDASDAADAADLLVDLASKVLEPPYPAERAELLQRLAGALDAVGACVLLDNVDGLVEDAATLLGELLARTQSLRVLVTSRESLRLSSEVLCALAPLPDDDGVALFVEQARAHTGAFVPSAHELEEVRAIVRVLDGIPLAIELAAGRVPLLPLEEIRARAADSLDVLSAQRRDTPERHRTLRAAVEASWNLLSPAARDALLQSAVFRGGFTASAAERVLEVSPQSPSVLELLDDLLGKSLLRTEVDPSGVRRLRLFECVRAFALERLDDDERRALLARHRRHFIAEAKRRVGLLGVPLGHDAVAWFLEESANLLAVFDSALEERSEEIIDVALVLHPFLLLYGPFETHTRTLGAALELARERGLARRVVELLIRLGELHFSAGRVVDARGLLEEALAICADRPRCTESEHIVRLEIIARLDLAGCYLMAREVETATAMLDHALLDARTLGTPCPLHRALTARAGVDLLAGRFRDAEVMCLEALAKCREAGDLSMECQVLNNLGVIYQWRGDYAEARGYVEQGLVPAEVLKSCVRLAHVHENLGLLALVERRLDEAGCSLELAREHALRSGHPALRARIDADIGILHLSQGELATGTTLVDDAVAELSRLGDARLAGVLRPLGAIGWALRRAPRRARTSLEQSRSAAQAPENLALAEAAVLLAEVWARQERGELDDAAALHAQATALLDADAHRPRTSSAMLRDIARALVDRLARSVEPGAAMELSSDGCCFRLRGGPLVDLSRRTPLRLILQALVEGHRAGRGSPLSIEELFQAGWPGEKALPKAQKNRVRVAVSTLRSLGLRDVLVSEGHRYRLHPELMLEEMRRS